MGIAGLFGIFEAVKIASAVAGSFHCWNHRFFALAGFQSGQTNRTAQLRKVPKYAQLELR
jgi:hypothetical protein